MDSRVERGDTRVMELTVTVSHDEKESVWFVQSSEVPGLNAEAPTLDALVEAISDLAPNLVAANMPEINAPFQLCVKHVVDAGHAHAA